MEGAVGGVGKMGCVSKLRTHSCDYSMPCLKTIAFLMGFVTCGLMLQAVYHTVLMDEGHCECFPGWEGDLCEIRTKPNNDPDCYPGWAGEHCEIWIVKP